MLTPPCEMIAFKDHVNVTLRPEITQASWSDVENFGANVRTELENRNSPACVVDLSPLTYMGSSIVALIVRVWKVVESRGGKMVVVCPHPGVIEVIKLAGLDKLWVLVPELTTAQKKLGVKPSAVLVAQAAPLNVSSAASAPTSSTKTERASSPSLGVLYFTLGAITALAALIVVLVIVSRQ
ncbi:MAG TPA: STAS domain-containing protein [Planctomicrobium sp.]|nr:STAS domain-containing protein [Planctomicrobium sp.]